MRIRNLIAALLLLATVQIQAQMPRMTLPVDSAVRIGKLANGLTYYIRYNNWPEKRANFYIAQKVGSIQEEESQRGLAHFLEHMAFNGSDNFKGNDIIEWCRSHGIQFGSDINAYTSIDETVYNINNVPTQREGVLDSCLLILRDWSSGLLLEQEEIDKERGVIHEEWRMRTSANNRLFERNLPKIYPGSKYGVRFPIGLMSVIDNFKRKELVDYYHKWYHPANQGIIVVGDVDVDRTEAQIKALFGSLKNPANMAPVVAEPVPDNAEPIIVIDKDKELQSTTVDLLFKHDTYPDSLKQEMDYLVEGYVKSAVGAMLGNRFYEASQKPDCAFIGAGAQDGSFLFSKTKDAFSLSAAPKDQSLAAEALKQAFLVVRQAAEFGFTETEYKRFQTDFLSTLEKMYMNKDKRYSSQYYKDCVGHFLTNEPMPSIEFSYWAMQQMAATIGLSDINAMLPKLISKSDSNMVIVNFNNEKEGAVYPTEAELLGAIHDARTQTIEPYVDKVKEEPLIAALPKAGKIKKEVKSKKFDYDILTLSNGVTVLLKQTDYKKDQVQMTGNGGSGSGNYGKEDLANIQAFNSVIEASGLGNFSPTELSKALTGKIANASLVMSDRRMGVSGSATPKDVETMLQLTYLYFTSIKKDNDSFNQLMQSYETGLKNRDLNPDGAFQDSLTATLYEHYWRTKPFVLEDIKQVNYDRILEMAAERTANANGWVFEIIGNFDPATIRPLICQYLGALPSKGKNPAGDRLLFTTTKNIDNTFYRKMETPKANSYIFWNNTKMPYTLEGAIQANIAGEILSMVYLKKIREEAGATYSCGAMANMSIGDDGYHMAQIVGYCPMKPEKKDEALTIMDQEVHKLAVSCDAEMLSKVQKAMIQELDVKVKTNGFWKDIVLDHYRMGIDGYTNYRSLVEAQTPEKISAFVKKLLADANKVSVVMLPEE